MWFKKLPIINFVSLLLIFLNVSLVQSEWHIEGIDTPPYLEVFSIQGIALGSDGVAHIAYGGDHLYHAHSAGNFWHHEIFGGKGHLFTGGIGRR